MKKILDYNHSDARKFFLKEESYFNFDLPKYFVFQELLEKISDEIQGKTLSSYYDTYLEPSGKKKAKRPCDFENVNYNFLNNKDGKFAWRPLHLIHPAIYVSLVHQITKEEHWSQIVQAFNKFGNNPKIKCLSLPVESESNLSDKATAINNWWHHVEQSSVQLSLKYEYVLHTDISNCYGSIYTHSIAWAIHTKNIAKDKRKDKSLIGNVIDCYIQDMSFAQTNGIPQGSVLMDFIAEMVLGFADYELSEKINNYSRLEDYEILRYRDDYRVFTNNPQDADLIVKLLTEVLIDVGLKLNTQKTSAYNNVVTSSFKPDKIHWILHSKGFNKLQDNLLFIHDFSFKYPNSGSLCKALDSFFNRIKKLKQERYDTVVLISILVDIMYRNPRTYPIASAILSKFISLVKSKEKKVDIIKTIIERLRKLPNIGYLEIWIQRITFDIDKGITLDEPICKILNGDGTAISLWNSDWISNSKLKEIIKYQKIIDDKFITEMDEVITEEEVRLFGSKDIYS